MRHIAIIGAGFSGTLILAHLMRNARAPLRVSLIDSAASFARGVAYATARGEHLLNVRAGRMSAFPDAPLHFAEWLAAAGEPYTTEDFAPRRVYGRYLEGILAEARGQAQAGGHALALVRAEAKAVRWQASAQKFQVETDSEKSLPPADAVVLACGTRAAVREACIPAWQWFEREEAALAEQVRSAEHILLIGTGLTMVDAAVTLRRLGRVKPVTAISRSGLLPGVHKAHDAYPMPAFAENPPRTALSLFTNLRAAADEAARAGVDWRDMLDALRPVTSALWQALPDGERARVFARLFTFWNVHRHRMAPEIFAELSALRAAGVLSVRRARVVSTRACDEGAEAVLALPGGARETMKAALILDCTGPAYDIRRAPGALFAQLRADGLVSPAGCGQGVAVAADLCVDNAENAPLYALGALVVGERFECTAVPDLRVQAAALAGTLIA